MDIWIDHIKYHCYLFIYSSHEENGLCDFIYYHKNY